MGEARIIRWTIHQAVVSSASFGLKNIGYARCTVSDCLY
jgi:hypothetical protein